MNGARQKDETHAAAALSALAALLLLIGGSGFVGISLLQTKWLERDALQAQFDALKRRNLAASAPHVEPKFSVKPFLGDENFALSANALQKRVVGLIEQTDGKLISVGVDPLVTGDADLARRVSVQVTAELTNNALQKVLYDLESAVPFAFVDSFTVNRPETAKSDPQKAPRLSVSLNVVGYRHKDSQ
jgi:hypothetical protein